MPTEQTSDRATDRSIVYEGFIDRVAGTSLKFSQTSPFRDKRTRSSRRVTSESMTRGPIGLPVRHAHNRNALLAMSAIQEERMSALQGSSIRPITSMTSSKEPKNSCDTSPTTSASSSDSSLDQPRPVCPAPTPASAPVIAGKTVKSRSSPESTTAAGSAKTTKTKPLEVVKNPSPTTGPKSPTRTSKARSTPLLSQASMAGAKALRSLRARAPAVPRFDGSASASSTSSSTSKKPPLKKKTKAQSVRSRPKAELVGHPLNEAAKQSAPTKYPLDLTALKGGRELPYSQPALCFEDLLASKAACQPTTEKRKPCVVDLRSGTSSTTAAPSSNKQSGHPPAAAKDHFAAAKSSVDLVFKQAKQTSTRLDLSDDYERIRGRASSDGGRMSVDIPILGDTIRARPRALSDSVSIPLLQRKKDPYARLRHYEGTFKNRRGQSLFYFSLFPPEKLAMRAVIVHLHGMGDHCRRSAALYERFCKAGFGVITYDLLNHGVSDCDRYKMRSNISNFDHFVDDTNDFITFAKSNIYKDALRYWRKHHHPRHPHGKEKRRRAPPELPLIISGASFGSLIGLHTVLAGEHKFHAAFWASPTIGVTWTKVLWAQWKFARPLVAAFPTAKVIPAIQHSLRSRDPEFLKRYHEDPLTISDMITPLSGHQSLHAMMRLQHDRRVVDGDSPFCGVPMLFLAGSVDRISDQQAAYKFYNQMGSLDKDFKLFDGLYHMIYEEPEKEEVLEYLVDWLHRRFRLETRHRVEP